MVAKLRSRGELAVPAPQVTAARNGFANREALIRQADLLAKRVHPRIAAKQRQFWQCEYPPYPHVIESEYLIYFFAAAAFKKGLIV